MNAIYVSELTLNSLEHISLTFSKWTGVRHKSRSYFITVKYKIIFNR